MTFDRVLQNTIILEASYSYKKESPQYCSFSNSGDIYTSINLTPPGNSNKYKGTLHWKWQYKHEN